MMGGSTPNIDRIVKEGALFTDYYAQQSCTAGRAAFILGQTPFRTGLLTAGSPAAKEGIQDKDPTIAELLKPYGYERRRSARTILALALYDAEGFQVANALNRFTVSSWMPFLTNADGSLDLYFQNESPGKDKEANWLPAPERAFNLTMRLYSPKLDALTGKMAPAGNEESPIGTWNGPKTELSFGPTDGELISLA
jgi:Protein of unknown function (DUF1214)/Sulfatase